MGALNPLLTSLLLRDSLQGRDRDGLFSATATGPVRYDDDGLIVEPAVTNYVRNPIAGTGTTSISGTAQSSVDRVTSLPAPLPGWLGPAVTTGILVTCTSSAASNLALFSADPASAIPHTIQAHVWLPSALSATGISLRVGQFSNVTPVDYPANMALRDQWQPVIGTFTPDAGDLSGNVIVRVTGGTMQVGEQIWVSVVAMQPESVATSPAVGSLGPGYSWAGTAHNSPSTRAASSASISPTGILGPASGAIAFRVTPTIETGLEEIWGECGVKGAGTDHMQWGRDATKHPFVEWSSNDAAYQRLTASETIDAGTETFLYFGHAGTTTSLQVDAGTLQTGSRAAVSASFGAGALTLRASAGGNIVSPFATYDQPLSAARRAIVRDAMANGDDLWTLFEEWEAIIQPTNLLPLQSGEATAGARATVTPATIPLTAQSLTGTSGASAEVEAADLVVAGGSVSALAPLPPIDVLAGGRPVRAEMEAGRPGIG